MENFFKSDKDEGSKEEDRNDKSRNELGGSINDEEGQSGSKEEASEVNSEGEQEKEREEEGGESEEALERCSLNLTGSDRDIEKCALSEGETEREGMNVEGESEAQKSPAPPESEADVVDVFETETAQVPPENLGKGMMLSDVKAPTQKRKTMKTEKCLLPEEVGFGVASVPADYRSHLYSVPPWLCFDLIKACMGPGQIPESNPTALGAVSSSAWFPAWMSSPTHWNINWSKGNLSEPLRTGLDGSDPSSHWQCYLLLVVYLLLHWQLILQVACQLTCLGFVYIYTPLLSRAVCVSVSLWKRQYALMFSVTCAVWSLCCCSFTAVSLSMSVFVFFLLQESETDKNIEADSSSIDVKVVMSCTHPSPFIHLFIHSFMQLLIL